MRSKLERLSRKVEPAEAGGTRVQCASVGFPVNKGPRSWRDRSRTHISVATLHNAPGANFLLFHCWHAQPVHANSTNSSLRTSGLDVRAQPSSPDSAELHEGGLWLGIPSFACNLCIDRGFGWHEPPPPTSSRSIHGVGR